MCIKKTESWAYDGKLYQSEAEAVNAALKTIGSKIISQFSAHPHEGLLAFRDELLELLPLAKYEKPIDTTSPESQKGPADAKPEGTRDKTAEGPAWSPLRFDQRGNRVIVFHDLNSTNKGIIRRTEPICSTESDHEWHTDPKSGGLIDYCLFCGEGRA